VGSSAALGLVERRWTEVLRTVRAAMLSVTARLRARLPYLTAADVEVCEDVVREALTAATDEATPSTQTPSVFNLSRRQVRPEARG
jgi:hypothetical protein